MGNAAYAGFDYTVPGDFSSCAFPLVAALITGSPISLHNLDMQDAQGDKALIEILQDIGADIVVDAENKALHVRSEAALMGKTIVVNEKKTIKSNFPFTKIYNL